LNTDAAEKSPMCVDDAPLSSPRSSPLSAARDRRRVTAHARGTHLHAAVAVSLLGVSLGCTGPAGDDAGEQADAGDAGTIACTVTLDDADGAVALGAGATAKFEIAGDEGVLSVTAPSTFTARIEGETLFVTAPNDANANGTVVVERDCGGAVASVELALTVRALVFEKLPSWSGGTTGPLGREYFSMRIDPVRPDKLIVHGGFHYVPAQFTIAWDSWIYDLVDQSWVAATQVGDPPHYAGGTLAVVAGDSTAYLYGGIGKVNDGYILPFSLAKVQVGETSLRFDAVSPSGAPANGDYQPAFFYDAPRARFVAIGGQGAAGTHMNVKVFDPAGAAWGSLAVAPGNTPSGRTGFFWVHDERTERFIVFSGEQGGPDWACNCAQDTWSLSLSEDPPTWRMLTAENPPGRRNGTYALDPLSHRMLIWGGTSNGQDTEPGLFALNLEEGNENWVELPTTGGAPIRSSGAMVFDAPRSRMLVGFGNDSIVGAHEDLWAIDVRPRD
jgi:hypothetical protein